jgi:hypothetical protein
MTVTLQDLADCVRRQMAEIDRQRAVIARQQMEIDHLVAWAENDFDALMCLQAIYRNPNTPEGNRLKALGLAVGYERAKPPSAEAKATFKLFDFLEERQRHRYVAGEPGDKVIEQAPAANGPDNVA